MLSYSALLFSDLMKSVTKQGMKVEDVVLGGIAYLDTRAEFWQQQKPIYARVRERRLRQQKWVREKKPKPTWRCKIPSSTSV